MRTLENYIAPTEHSQGDVGDIWIDKSTGDVYKCTGITGSAKDLGYITIGADATNTKYTWEKAGAGGGGAEIPTCTVRFMSGKNVVYTGLHHHTKYENGTVVRESNADYAQEELSEFDITLENVVCGSLIYFSWYHTGMEPSLQFEGSQTARQLADNIGVLDSCIFEAPSEKGAICTITIDAIM